MSDRSVSRRTPEQPGRGTPADPPADDRKDRVVHARIPEDLDRALRHKAGRLGLSVSNLVRNVLQNTFGLVEDIVSDSASVARSARGGTALDGAPQPGTSAARAILGWQELVLGLNAVCDRCNAILSKGTQAALAVHDRPGPRLFLCPKCLKKEIGR